MTTYREEKVRCAVCGKKSEQSRVNSSSTCFRDTVELDLKPVHMKSIDVMLDLCPSCGYAAYDLSELLSNAKSIVKSDKYTRQLEGKTLPKNANALLCLSMLYESSGDYHEAGRVALKAAWVCERVSVNEKVSKKEAEQAKICRKKAALLLEKAIKDGKGGEIDEHADEMMILIDALRCTGQYDKALRYCLQAIRDNKSHDRALVLFYQLFLVNREDSESHDTTELVEVHLQESDLSSSEPGQVPKAPLKKGFRERLPKCRFRKYRPSSKKK